MSEWQEFCENYLGYITAETDWITHECDEFDSISFSEIKELFRNQQERLLFFNLQDAMKFLNKNYIDPLLSDRYIRRHSQYRDFFILVSSYDTKLDERFDYFIYDEELSKEYIDYIYGKDEIIFDVTYPVSRKIKIENNTTKIQKSDVGYVSHKCFKLTDYMQSNIIDYKHFKLKELFLRRRELELFNKLYHDEWVKMCKPLPWGGHPIPPPYYVWDNLKKEIKSKLYVEFRDKYLTQEDKERKFPLYNPND